MLPCFGVVQRACVLIWSLLLVQLDASVVQVYTHARTGVVTTTIERRSEVVLLFLFCQAQQVVYRSVKKILLHCLDHIVVLLPAAEGESPLRRRGTSTQH